MAFIPVPGVIETRIRARLDGQEVENTLYWTDLTTPGEPRVQECADLVRDNVRASWLSSLHENWFGTEVYAIDLSAATGGAATAPFNSTDNGELTGDQLPNNCSLCVSFRTAFRGRSFRGRNYWMGLADSDVIANTVNNSRIGAITLAYLNLQAAMQLSDFQHTVVSRYSGGAPRAVGLPSIVTEVLIVDPVVDSQRRRLPGRGR